MSGRRATDVCAVELCWAKPGELCIYPLRLACARRQGIGLVPRDPCPACNAADLEPFGGKHRCPRCGYLQPCCDP